MVNRDLKTLRLLAKHYNKKVITVKPCLSELEKIFGIEAARKSYTHYRLSNFSINLIEGKMTIISWVDDPHNGKEYDHLTFEAVIDDSNIEFLFKHVLEALRGDIEKEIYNKHLNEILEEMKC